MYVQFTWHSIATQLRTWKLEANWPHSVMGRRKGKGKIVLNVLIASKLEPSFD